MARELTFPGELIGKTITIISATNLSLVGKTGKVIDETKATVTIDCGGEKKIILKQDVVLRVTEIKTTIKGSSLLKRPEERIKG